MDLRAGFYFNSAWPAIIGRASSSEFDLLTFINSRADGGFYLAADTTIDRAGTTPTTVNNDPIGRWIDQSAHGNDIQAGADGTRGIRSMRDGVVMCQMDQTDDYYAAPAGASGNVCTFFFESRHGPQCFTWDAGVGIPATQASRFGWVLGTVTSQERADILAALSTDGFVEYFDAEAISLYFGIDSYYALDRSDIGATIDIEASIDGLLNVDSPPWGDGNGYSTGVVLSTARQGINLVISDITTITDIGIGWDYAGNSSENALGYGQVFDLTQYPEIVSYMHYSNGLEGCIPFSSVPTTMRFFSIYPYNALSLDKLYLHGRLPSLTGCAVLETFAVQNTCVTGAVPSLADCPLLKDIWLGDNNLSGEFPDPSATSVIHVYVNGNSFTSIASSFAVPASCISFDISGSMLPSSEVNKLLAAFVAAGANNGQLYIEYGGGNSAPTGQGIIDKATLQSRGWIVD